MESASAPAFSPDGRWLAYESRERDGREIYVRSYPALDAPILISFNGGEKPAWSRNGRELFYEIRGSDTKMVVDVDPSRAGREAFGIPEVLFDQPLLQIGSIPRGYDVLSDGTFVWMSDPPQTPQPVTQINIVLNWFEELKRLVPTGR
jgi:hypothetical protein